MSAQTVKNQTNKALRPFNGYFAPIPLSEIFEVVKTFAGQVVQEDGTPWSGFLCGEAGTARFAVKGYRFHLVVSWYLMNSGRFEICAYVA